MVLFEQSQAKGPFLFFQVEDVLLLRIGFDELIDKIISEADGIGITGMTAIVYLLDVGPDNGTKTHGAGIGRRIQNAAT